MAEAPPPDRLTPLELAPWMACASEALSSADPRDWAKEQRWHDEIPWEDRRAFWTTQGMKHLPHPSTTDPVPVPWRQWMEEVKRHPCQETGEEHVRRWVWWRHSWGAFQPPTAFLETIAELAPMGWLDAHPDTGHSPALDMLSFPQALAWMRVLNTVPAWQPAHTDHVGDQLWATWLMRVALEREGGDAQEAMAVAAWEQDYPRDGQAHGQSLWSWLAHSEQMGNAWKARNGEPGPVPPADRARAALMNQKLPPETLHEVLDEEGEAIWESLPGRLPLADAWLTQSRLKSNSDGQRVRFWTYRGEVLQRHGWQGTRSPQGLRQWASLPTVDEGVPSLIQEKNLRRWATVVAALLTREQGNLCVPFPVEPGPIARQIAQGVLGLHYLDQEHPRTEGSRLQDLDRAWQVTHWPPAAVWAVVQALPDAWEQQRDSTAKTCVARAIGHWEGWAARAEAQTRLTHTPVLNTGALRRRRRS